MQVINNQADKRGLHPTQKPIELCEYFIKNYSREGETVLDFTMGSGSTGIACINTGRAFIGIEKDDEYFQVAKARIEGHQAPIILLNETENKEKTQQELAL